MNGKLWGHTLTNRYLQRQPGPPHLSSCRHTCKTCMYPHPWHTQTSILLIVNAVTKLFTGNSTYFATIIQMKDQQQTADLLAELFSCPSVPERPLMQAVLSWKSSFLSERASSVTNRRPCSYEMRACSTDVSCLSYSLFLPIYIHVLDGTSWLKSGSRLFTGSLGNIRDMWTRAHERNSSVC